MSSESIEAGSLYFNFESQTIEADEAGLRRLAEAAYTALEEGNSNVNLAGSNVKCVVLLGDRDKASEYKVSIFKKALSTLLLVVLFIWFVVLPFVSIVIIVKLYNEDESGMRPDCATFHIQGLLKQYGY